MNLSFFIFERSLFLVLASLCLLPVISLTAMELTKKSPTMHQTSIPSKEFFLSSSFIMTSLFAENYIYRRQIVQLRYKNALSYANACKSASSSSIDRAKNCYKHMELLRGVTDLKIFTDTGNKKYFSFKGKPLYYEDFHKPDTPYTIPRNFYTLQW